MSRMAGAQTAACGPAGGSPGRKGWTEQDSKVQKTQASGFTRRRTMLSLVSGAMHRRVEQRNFVPNLRAKTKALDAVDLVLHGLAAVTGELQDQPLPC